MRPIVTCRRSRSIFIKIDKSFVQMASVDEISGHIVDNIVELARKPGLSIVAEGVETQEQADLMIGKGVHFFTGLFVLSASTG
ncbi:putative signal transduction protein [Escherichia coli]|uniref:Putative signal transduction protein n=1 Tax=Escherichia coli TaxID=562 RepID=A0A484W136_ECOLX|nr:putative signal transduction protein [Escherichia coli]